MKFHWMKIISLAAIAMVRGQNNEISFFDERERERGGGRRDCPTFVENICTITGGIHKPFPKPTKAGCASEFKSGGCANHQKMNSSRELIIIIYFTLIIHPDDCQYI